MDVLNGDTLTFAYSPDTYHNANGTFFNVTWSQDGSHLYAGGGATGPASLRIIRAWSQAGQGTYQDLNTADDTIMAIHPLRNGGLVYGAGEPSIGLFDASRRKVWEKRAPLADFRRIDTVFKVSRDGSVVDFAYESGAKSPARINVNERRVVLGPPADARLAAPVTSAPGIDLQGWLHMPSPTLNGKPLAIEPYELARSVTITPDRQHVILGAE